MTRVWGLFVCRVVALGLQMPPVLYRLPSPRSLEGPGFLFLSEVVLPTGVARRPPPRWARQWGVLGVTQGVPRCCCGIVSGVSRPSRALIRFRLGEQFRPPYLMGGGVGRIGGWFGARVGWQAAWAALSPISPIEYDAPWMRPVQHAIGPPAWGVEGFWCFSGWVVWSVDAVGRLSQSGRGL